MMSKSNDPAPETALDAAAASPQPVRNAQHPAHHADHTDIFRAVSDPPVSDPPASDPAATAASEAHVSTEGLPSPPQVSGHVSAQRALPKQIGRFEVRQLLGQGAFGQVFRAWDPMLERDVAIKLPLTERLTTEEDVQRFLREAKVAATLRHANICPVYEVGGPPDPLFLVMGFIDGKTLAAHLQARGTPLPIPEAVGLVQRLAHALEFAHQKGIVHRDLKPANVMLDREQQDVVVMDFGLARLTKAGDSQLTQDGLILGTPAYMAPEQAAGRVRELGPAVDIYSLGVVLYELLAGRLPFTGSVAEVIGQVLHVLPEPPSRHRPDLDPRLDALCLRALAKEPSERFGSMREFAAALDSFSAPVALAAPGAAPVETEAFLPTTNWDMRLPKAKKPPKKHNLNVALGLASGLLVLLLAGVIVLYTRSGDALVQVVLESKVDADLLADGTVTYRLNERALSADDLKRPLELTPGEHLLIAKQGHTELQRYRLQVRQSADGKSATVQVVDVTGRGAPARPPGTKINKIAPQKSWQNSLGMMMIVLPPGEFLMGSPPSEPSRDSDETPHRVTLTKGFALAAHEVTVGQFRQFVDAEKFVTDAERGAEAAGFYNQTGSWETRAGYSWKKAGFPQTDQHPVVNVSWYDAVAFCQWLSQREGKTYRLPSEAEWEYACRAGTTTAFFHGDDPEGITAYGNVADGAAHQAFPSWLAVTKSHDDFVYTAPVGLFKPNRWGLFDLHGNVWEWTADVYAPFTNEPATDPFVAQGDESKKTARGGGIASSPDFCRSASRDWSRGVISSCFRGFRVAANLGP